MTNIVEWLRKEAELVAKWREECEALREELADVRADAALLRADNAQYLMTDCAQAADEIEALREQLASLQASSGYEASIAQVEIERLRAALQEIILRYDTDTDEMEGPAKDMRAIARRALEPKP